MLNVIFKIIPFWLKYSNEIRWGVMHGDVWIHKLFSNL